MVKTSVLKNLISCLLFSLLLLLTPAAFAAKGWGPCQKEIKKHCSDMARDNMDGIIKCLSINNRHLSSACERHVENIKKARKEKKAKEKDSVPECQAEQRRHCSGVKPGNGRMKACLRLHKEKISPKCRDALKKKSLFY